LNSAMIDKLKFIIVDDDLFGNILTERIIKKVADETDVTIFNLPEDGLAYIRNQPHDSFGSTILLLDINMPGITGWEFLDQFDKFGNEINPPMRIYIFSSSINQRDKDKAFLNKYIKGFISKPLTVETIAAMITASLEME
jgi:CheY-like chemotaxis protein